jgi:hypothetical protein
MSFFMDTFSLILVLQISSLLNGSISLLHLTNLFLFILTLFLSLLASLMTLLPIMLLLPFCLFPVDSQPELISLLPIFKTMFVIMCIILLTLLVIIFLILSCLINILVLFSHYTPTLNPTLSLRQTNLTVGDKLCKLSFLLLSQLVHGN